MSRPSLDTSAANSSQNTESLAEIALTSDDFHFAYHENPERFFNGGKRPLRLIQTEPPLTTCSDVTYIPATRSRKQKLGCLYDDELNRIEASVTRRGRNDTVINTDPEHLAIEADQLPVYDRPVLYLGLLRPHFGHFIYESMSYWWALLEELGDIDHCLIHMYDPRVLDKPHIKTALNAMQIKADRLLYFDEPVRLKTVIVPTSSFQLKSHIYTKYRESQNRVARALGAEISEPSDQPVFLSRSRESRGVRKYVGEEKIESFLSTRGVRIAHPGQMPFTEQIKLVNEHKYIMGFQGSQLASTALSLQPRTLIHFTDKNVASTQLLIDRCYDHDSTYVNVCKFQNIPRELYRVLVARTIGSRIKFNGFAKKHQVDYEKAVAWLETSGYLS